VSTLTPGTLESYLKSVPLPVDRETRPLMGCRARRWLA
jgi:hypothetical protein